MLTGFDDAPVPARVETPESDEFEYTFRQRFLVKPVAPPFIGNDAKMAMIIPHPSGGFSLHDAVLDEECGFVVVAKAKRPIKWMSSLKETSGIRIGWLVGCAFIEMLSIA